MSTTQPTTVTAQVEINAPIEKIWEVWTNPDHIKQWNNMSDEWHTPKVENDVRPGGRFLYVMAKKDGSFSFDFEGTYNDVKIHELITYTLDDGRKTTNIFKTDNPVKITETFEPNQSDPPEMQLQFCQAVLDSFKKYVEGFWTGVLRD